MSIAAASSGLMVSSGEALWIVVTWDEVAVTSELTRKRVVPVR
jgi:hypothetical protein